jgi:hypothetical protein
VKTTPSRQFDFGLGGIANHLAKAGCFTGGLKAPHAGAGPILFAEAKRLGTLQQRLFTAKTRRRILLLNAGKKAGFMQSDAKNLFSGGHGVPFKLKPRPWRRAVPL